MKSFLKTVMSLGFFFLLSVSGVWPTPQGVPQSRLAFLAKGINLNASFTSWSGHSPYGNRLGVEEVTFLKKAGFTVVRLPLNPNLLFDPADPAHPKLTLVEVDRTVSRVLAAGLSVVFDPIHGSSENADWESSLAHDPAFLEKVKIYWEALARHYAAFSSDHIFFELMNEPHLTKFETIDGSWWSKVQAQLAKAVRRGAPFNTILATGESWGSVDGLLTLPPLDDPNVVYSFHSYDPFVFTHQGASWAGPTQAALNGVPYPATTDNVVNPSFSLADPTARKQLVQYGKEGWNRDRILVGLKRASDWAKKNQVTLFCGEFGVYRKVAPQPDRLRWITDVRQSLETLGIGWAMWDYESDFGLITYDEPQSRRGLHVDVDALKALGLDSTAALALGSGKATTADFTSGKISRLDMPVEDWLPFWSREPGAGEGTFLEDPDGNPVGLVLVHRGEKDWAQSLGYPIPVKPGEKFVLESKASFTGTGSGAMELVARDAAGKVLSWTLGKIVLTSGSEKDLRTPFEISGAIATVEPRWSGTGPSQLVVRGFRLKHIN